MAQQALARRFRLEHACEFESLQRIKDGLLKIFKNEGHSTLWLGNYPIALSYWLTALEYRSTRQSLRAGDFETVYSRLGGEEQITSWKVMLVPVCDFLRGQVAVVDDLVQKFNYFDYVSLLSMASLSRGDQLCVAYANTGNLSDSGDEEYWIFQNSIIYPLEVRCSIKASSSPERFESPSLHILDSRQYPALDANFLEGEALYFRIGLDRAPADIDHAMHHLRSALNERLLEVHQGVRIPEWEKYADSNFATAQLLPLADLRLLHDKQQMIARFRGFWCWDLVESGTDSLDSRTAAKMVSEKIADEDGVPGPKPIHDQYELVRQLISPQHDATSDLDMFYCQKDKTRLGLRSNAQTNAHMLRSQST